MTEKPFDDEATSPEGEAPAAGTDQEQVSEEAAPDPVAELEAKVAELTNDLQRKQAEFINYKRRVEDDRVRAVETGKQKVLTELLTVLDDLGRAEEHGELTGGFKAVADQLRGTVGKFDLVSFGEAGEPFDPNLHEAVFHAGEDPNVAVQSIAQVMRTGYRVGDRVLRPAVVGVVDPGVAAEATEQPVSPED
ncbi:nucleotide exchange factor GrpE [Aeromicrobium choanae]|uniref:Protein GrpE n=1 Tax=Aeromicrobium choanae TaxID=1736691 RepID=A0A1T4Z1I4_9ACTN|nr:nucleotide exchange factor GrpE [Aeromicrobium choanae]SKB07806.1 molecular chaperone GrpE [Aeromicrobium choanae]